MYLVFFLFWCLALQAREFAVHETCALLEELISAQEKGAYLCFSEDDLRVIVGEKGDFLDQVEMRDVFALSGKNVLKSRFLPRTALDGPAFGERWAAEAFSRADDSWIDCYAALSPAFLSTPHRRDCVRFFQFLQSKDVIILSDSWIAPATRDLLFGPQARLISSQEAGEIELDTYTVIVLCEDLRGKVLSKKLLDRLPIYLIDLSGFGEVLSGWSTDVWKKWMQIENEIKILYTNEIKILYTSALIPYKFEERKQEYIKCLKLLENYGYIGRTYVVESGPYTALSFFDEYCDHVFYANTNDTTWLNKGVNESKASLAAFNYFNFDDEDMIIKLTGRYLFNNDHFLALVEAHPEVDAFASRIPPWGVTTGCFAMRSKYYKRMLKELDLVKMERNALTFEWEVYLFLRKMISEGAKVVYLDKIGITANVANERIEQW